ncbi:hypothetical protein OBBRIDRAFT_653790 [Obba rivulosa]|uniref:Uncharacterized protein n=1 Tax=Obba rivulosa TaxID=1052685 RepID=A0A8E2DK56_9APHY|nr:hypothetical protein OBBRIDRAFT_653790 [Obba rivulosa]
MVADRASCHLTTPRISLSTCFIVGFSAADLCSAAVLMRRYSRMYDLPPCHSPPHPTLVTARHCILTSPRHRFSPTSYAVTAVRYADFCVTSASPGFLTPSPRSPRSDTCPVNQSSSFRSATVTSPNAKNASVRCPCCALLCLTCHLSHCVDCSALQCDRTHVSLYLPLQCAHSSSCAKRLGRGQRTIAPPPCAPVNCVCCLHPLFRPISSVLSSATCTTFVPVTSPRYHLHVHCSFGCRPLCLADLRKNIHRLFFSTYLPRLSQV